MHNPYSSDKGFINERTKVEGDGEEEERVSRSVSICLMIYIQNVRVYRFLDSGAYLLLIYKS